MGFSIFLQYCANLSTSKMEMYKKKLHFCKWKEDVNLDEEKEFCFWQGKKIENVLFLFLTSVSASFFRVHIFCKKKIVL